MDLLKHWPMAMLIIAVILILVLIILINRKTSVTVAAATPPVDLAGTDIQKALSNIQASCESLGFIRPSAVPAGP